jgi:UDP-GlcNAc:undecaprenyl-phosphate/decaprenyl-phosphate GlcNAc-1-phosphate transferase
MLTYIIPALLPFATAAVSAIIFYPLFIKWSPGLGLVDKPNERKLHIKPVPAIGGMVIVLSLMIAVIFSTPLQQLIINHWALSVSIVVLAATGIIDDRLSLSPGLRFGVQIACALLIAHHGIRLYSFHGLFGIQILPVYVQYIFSVLIMVGITNAFNLIDGIDGLAGGISMVNISVLIFISVLTGAIEWTFLLFPLLGALIVFLKYNWRPAKVFLGDGGSLVFGFIFSALGLSLIKSSEIVNPAYTSLIVVLITACCMIPAIDTLRVFYSRIKSGKSPFSADRNHLHHWLIRHRMMHSEATGKLISLHIIMIIISGLAILTLSIPVVILFQVILVLAYTKFLQLNYYFHRWYRFIKKMEAPL